MHLKSNLSPAAGRIIRNLLFWLLLAFYFASGRSATWRAFPPLLLVLLMSFAVPAYVHNDVLVPKLLLRRRYWWYALSLAVLLFLTAGCSLLSMQFINYLFPWLEYMGKMKGVTLPYHLIPTCIILTMLALGKLTAEAIKNERRLERLEKERLNTELESLRAQINPHFLFNALNTIYGMARKQDEHTADAVIKLSDILRHGLYECEDGEAMLEQEIAFLQQYVDFARLRMQHRNCIKMHIEVEDYGMLRMAPMLLTPFVENAIKHGCDGNMTDPAIEISLSVKKNRLTFVCENSYDRKRTEWQNPAAEQGGIGIRNVQRRLELLYSGKHHLNINDSGTRFRVEMNLQLHEPELRNNR